MDRINPMDSQQLLTFIAIAESGSFSAAAQRLHLTQPAISKRVALLELHLNTRLFDRLGKQVSLTSAGHSFLPHARKILQTVADAERVISDLGGHVAGRLSLATSHHIGLHHLPPILSDFSRRYPAVHLDLHFLDSE
ncbi:MAG TPA: LysR family transcriptional regulator, partial [Marinobacter sp.]|nr:LysR family transcriptional regulator [Marinobacter sp.]